MSASKYQTLGNEHSLRVVLVGQERVGKSSAGNTILGKETFDCRFTMTTLTLTSQEDSAMVLGRRVSVVDTPGLFSSQLSEGQVKAELERAVELSSPGPHVFLLCVQLGRFTEQERKGLQMLEKILCPGVCKHTMILFTYGDRLEGMDIDEFVQGDQNLLKVLQRCSGQYQVFNNREVENKDQVEELLRKVEQVSQRGRYFYTKSSQLQILMRQFRGSLQSALHWCFNKKVIVCFSAILLIFSVSRRFWTSGEQN